MEERYRAKLVERIFLSTIPTAEEQAATSLSN